MIQLKRILAPTDFSKYSDNALKYACAFAEQFKAELHLLYVVQDIVAGMPEPGMFVPPLDNMMVELEKSGREQLQTRPPASLATKLTVIREVCHGSPFVEIVRYAKSHNIDLIVAGTHGRSGLAHVLLGSVAERIVRKAPCPVLTVKEAKEEPAHNA